MILMRESKHLNALLIDVLKGERDAHHILADLLEEMGDVDKSDQARMIADSSDALQLSIGLMPYRVAVRLACDSAERVFRLHTERRIDDPSPFDTVRLWLQSKVSDAEMNRACRVLCSKRLLGEFVYVVSNEQCACAERLAAALRAAFLVVHQERHYGADADTGKAREYANTARAEAAFAVQLARIAAHLPLEPRRWLRRQPVSTTDGHRERSWQTKRAISLLMRD